MDEHLYSMDMVADKVHSELVSMDELQKLSNRISSAQTILDECKKAIKKMAGEI